MVSIRSRWRTRSSNTEYWIGDRWTGSPSRVTSRSGEVDPHRAQVDHEAGRPQRAVTTGHHLADAQGQLLDAHRLGQVVVGPVGESLDAGVGIAGGRDHDHRGAGLGAGQLGQQLVRVAVGDVPVEDEAVVDDVHHRRADLGQRGDRVDGEAVAAQPASEGVRQTSLVLEEQHPHGESPFPPIPDTR